MKPLADHVVETYGAAVARIAASYERDHGLREELAQDMLLAILVALPRLREPQKLRAYIFRIAHNRGMRHIIARMRAPVLLAQPDAVADAAPSPEHAFIADEQGAALLEAVRQLPLAYRQVITLLLEDLSYAEIADVLGLSPGNVGVRINRAKHQLRKALDHDR
jgi:RNA polymerase sigma-70 factor (ECF subfamily)